MRRPFVIAIFFIAALSTFAGAQQHAVENSTLLSARARAEFSGGGSVTSQSVIRRTLHTAAGALLGAGVGYFTSHVVHSDWDEAGGSSYAAKRRTYSLGGAGVGALAGLLMGGSQPGFDSSGGAVPIRRQPGGGETISSDEISSVMATNAYEVVQSLRPNWLVTRGSKAFTEQGQIGGTERDMTSTPGMPRIRAYLDEASLGDVEELRRISTGTIGSIHFLSAAQAALRFGAGHAHGAIVVLTASASD